MTVLSVEPMKIPQIAEMEDDLASLQKAVGGYIEMVYPFRDSVCVICNEEGKLNGLPLNRALRDNDGEVYDVIAGNFLVAGLSEEGLVSLTPDQQKKFEALFHSPEQFIRTPTRILPIRVSDEKLAKAAGREREKVNEHAGRDR